MKSTQIIVFIFLSAILSQCKGKNAWPKNVPEKATYHRKLNGYALKSDGYEFGWYENGNLVTKTKLNDFGVFDGRAERYDYKTGVLVSFGQYKMSEKDGNWQWKFSDGKPYYEMNFSQGVRKRKFWYPTIEWGNENGPYVRYFENGRVSEKGFYDGGNKSGDWVKYYPDTKIESKGSYLEDHKTGEWYYYYPDGRKEAVEHFSDAGDLVSRQTFYPNGSLWCQTKGSQESICN
jgi:antitoxin component YwqK of YwqJK toxin-antitoxin module